MPSAKERTDQLVKLVNVMNEVIKELETVHNCTVYIHDNMFGPPQKVSVTVTQNLTKGY